MTSSEAYAGCSPKTARESLAAAAMVEKTSWGREKNGVHWNDFWSSFSLGEHYWTSEQSTRMRAMAVWEQEEAIIEDGKGVAGGSGDGGENSWREGGGKGGRSRVANAPRSF
jgi:hypothetical protein